MKRRLIVLRSDIRRWLGLRRGRHDDALGAHTYTGTTTVSAGTLIIAGNVSSSPMTVNGGTLWSPALSAAVRPSTAAARSAARDDGRRDRSLRRLISPGMSVGTLATGQRDARSRFDSRFELATPGVAGRTSTTWWPSLATWSSAGRCRLRRLWVYGAGSYPLFTYTTIAAN